MNSRILISGARAPVCLELTRQFSKRQIKVEVADSFSVPLTRFSSKIAEFHEIASPRFEFEKFCQQIQNLQKEKSFDLIIPTCEEVFYFSKLKELMPIPEIFCDRFDKLLQLHNKWSFYLQSLNWSLQAPQSFLLQRHEDWQALKLNSKDFVFKPVYSRFAAQTLIGPEPAQLRKINWSAGQWIAQRKITGDEVCVYIVCHHGDLKAFCSYRPTYRVGLGAGIFLEPYFDETLVSFCEEFVEHSKFHGQIAFDLIYDRQDKRYWLLECNPRSTSGVNFFDSRLVDCFYNLNRDLLFGDRKHPRMLASAMLIYGFPWQLNSKTWPKSVMDFARDFNRGKDIIWDAEDKLPFFAQYISFAKFIAAALVSGQSVIQISSKDIEYNA